jgi:recombination protein RecR
MPVLPDSVQDLINALERLPGIGPRTASRLTFFLLRSQDDLNERLAEALTNIKVNTIFCPVCFYITDAGREFCEICADPRRNDTVLCVVEEPLDVLALERTGAFQGRYHVLHGVIAPVEGIGPEDLKILPLINRVRQSNVHEVILATNPSMEGDVTAMYIQQQLASMAVKVTRLARGLPVGGDLEYADQNTLLRALSGRQDM